MDLVLRVQTYLIQANKSWLLSKLKQVICSKRLWMNLSINNKITKWKMCGLRTQRRLTYRITYLPHKLQIYWWVKYLIEAKLTLNRAQTRENIRSKWIWSLMSWRDSITSKMLMPYLIKTYKIIRQLSLEIRVWWLRSQKETKFSKYKIANIELRITFTVRTVEPTYSHPWWTLTLLVSIDFPWAQM